MVASSGGYAAWQPDARLPPRWQGPPAAVAAAARQPLESRWPQEAAEQHGSTEGPAWQRQRQQQQQQWQDWEQQQQQQEDLEQQQQQRQEQHSSPPAPQTPGPSLQRTGTFSPLRHAADSALTR
jgi:hypothetical protein